jgi:hypothetical protein
VSIQLSLAVSEGHGHIVDLDSKLALTEDAMFEMVWCRGKYS